VYLWCWWATRPICTRNEPFPRRRARSWPSPGEQHFSKRLPNRTRQVPGPFHLGKSYLAISSAVRGRYIPSATDPDRERERQSPGEEQLPRVVGRLDIQNYGRTVGNTANRYGNTKIDYLLSTQLGQRALAGAGRAPCAQQENLKTNRPNSFKSTQQVTNIKRLRCVR